MSTNPWNISTLRIFFHVLYGNAMIFDSYLKPVWLTALESLNLWVLRLIGRLGWTVSVNEWVGAGQRRGSMSIIMLFHLGA